MKTNFLVLSAGLCLASILTSCTKDAIPTYEEAQKEAYTNSFVAKYGQISPTQSWDFTTGEPNLAKTRGVSTITVEVLEKVVVLTENNNRIFVAHFHLQVVAIKTTTEQGEDIERAGW